MTMQVYQITLYANGEYLVLRINKLIVTFTKDRRGYEELYMAINTGAVFQTYNTKDFSNCNSNTKRIEFEAVSNLLVKARMIHEDSNYTINVHQQYSKSNDLLVVILCNAAIVLLLIIVFTILSIVYLRIRKRQILYLERKTQEDLELRQDHISK